MQEYAVGVVGCTTLVSDAGLKKRLPIYLVTTTDHWVGRHMREDALDWKTSSKVGLRV